MAYSARRISVNALEKFIAQNNHGFDVGNIVTFNGAAYVLAQGNNIFNSQGVLMVSVVPDPNHFVVVQDGYINNLPLAKSPGIQWYLDPINPGQLTSVEPSGVGNVILPCFVSTGSFEGYFQSNAGQTVESGPSTSWFDVTVDINLVPNNSYYVTVNSTVTLPLLSVIGDMITIANFGATGFTIAQNAAQEIFGIGAATHTTFGNTGTLVTTIDGASVQIVCLVANGAWQILSQSGDFVFN